MNHMRDHASLDRQILINAKPVSSLASFLFGALAFIFIALPIACGIEYMLMDATIREAEMRDAKQVIIRIGETDARCLEWRNPRSNEWVCVQR